AADLPGLRWSWTARAAGHTASGAGVNHLRTAAGGDQRAYEPVAAAGREAVCSGTPRASSAASVPGVARVTIRQRCVFYVGRYAHFHLQCKLVSGGPGKRGLYTKRVIACRPNAAGVAVSYQPALQTAICLSNLWLGLAT